MVKVLQNHRTDAFWLLNSDVLHLEMFISIQKD